jgi:hypothetical protein
MLPEPRGRPGGNGGIIAFLVLLFVLGGAGGAYFSGAVPPHSVQKLGLPAR